METLAALWDLVVHLDRHLAAFVAQHGTWVYALLFAIVFCETGLVVTPFLPGDSLLFVTGALAAAGGMDIAVVITVLVSAALCGDNVNYWIGRWIGPRVFHYKESRWFNPKHLERARARSTSGTAARRSSLRASCPSSAPTSRSSPGSAR
jgi:membrane-associated protein